MEENIDTLATCTRRDDKFALFCFVLCFVFPCFAIVTISRAERRLMDESSYIDFAGNESYWYI